MNRLSFFFAMLGVSGLIWSIILILIHAAVARSGLLPLDQLENLGEIARNCLRIVFPLAALGILIGILDIQLPQF